MNFELADHHLDIQRAVREFCEEKVKPRAAEWDATGKFPSEVVKELGALGVMGITVPEEYGGAAMDIVANAVIVEEVARYDGSLALPVASHNGLGSGHIRFFGSEAQKKRWLVPLAKGEKL